MNEYTIELYQSTSIGATHGKYFWHMTSSNGRIVADSGEGYHNKADLLNELTNIKRSISAAIIIDNTK